MKIPKVVRCHPNRPDMFMFLKREHFPDCHMCMDHGLGVEKNTLRQYEMLKFYCEDQDAEWGMVLDEDMIPVSGLGEYLPDFVKELPDDAGFGSFHEQRDEESEELFEDGETGWQEQEVVLYAATVVRSDLLDEVVSVMEDIVEEGVGEGEPMPLIEKMESDFGVYRHIPSFFQHDTKRAIRRDDASDLISYSFPGKDFDLSDMSVTDG